MARAGRMGRAVVAGLGLLAAGCATGPHWKPATVSLQALAPHAPVSGVVVSDFYVSLYETSTTQSGRIREIREAVNVRDISLDIASGLRAAGIPARAMAGVGRGGLAPGEVLVRGTLRSNPLPGTDELIYALEMACSLGIFGCLLPFPCPMPTGAEFDVRVDALDDRGNILMSSTERLKGYYSNYWLYTSSADQRRRLVPDLEQRVVAALVQRLRQGPGAAAPGPAAAAPRPHPTAPNVVIQPDGSMTPAPGYRWVVPPSLDPTGRDLRVVPAGP